MTILKKIGRTPINYICFFDNAPEILSEFDKVPDANSVEGSTSLDIVSDKTVDNSWRDASFAMKNGYCELNAISNWSLVIYFFIFIMLPPILLTNSNDLIFIKVDARDQ